METVGERIKIAREAAGMTQEQLGKMLGVTGVSVMRYEKNTRQPRMEQLREIADVLGVTVGYLLGYESIQSSSLINAVKNRDAREIENILGLEQGSVVSVFNRRERNKQFLSNDTVRDIIERLELLPPDFQQFVLNNTLYLIDELLKLQGLASKEGDPGAVDPKENE